MSFMPEYPNPISVNSDDHNKRDESSKQKKDYEAGDLIYDQYEITGVKQNGNYGIVYICKEIATGLMYALKCTNKNFNAKTEMDSFYQEIKNWMLIPIHPNVVPVVGVFKINLVPYIKMPYVTGDENYGLTLQDWIDNKYIFGITDVLYIMLQIFRGMIHCINSYEERGLGVYIHGDLKPNNIFIQKDESGYTVKIADCGGIAQSNIPKGWEKSSQTDIYQCITIMMQLCNCSDGVLIQMTAYLNDMFLDNNKWQLYNFHKIYELFSKLFERIHKEKSFKVEDILPPYSKSFSHIQSILTLSMYEIQVTREYDSAYSRLDKLYKEIDGKNIIINGGVPLEVEILRGMMRASQGDFDWGKFEKSINMLQSAVKKMPDSAENKIEKAYSFVLSDDLQTELGIAYFCQGRYQESAKLLGHLDFDNFFNFDWIERLMKSYVLTQNIEELRALGKRICDFIKKLEKNGADKYKICNLKIFATYIYPLLGEFEAAVSLCEECLAADPDNLEYLSKYSEILVRIGRVIESRRPLHRLYRLCEINLKSEIADRMTLYYYMTTALYMLADFEQSYNCHNLYMQYHDNSDRKTSDSEFLELICRNCEEFAAWKKWREEHLSVLETYEQLQTALAMYEELTENYTAKFGAAYYNRAKYQSIVDIFQKIVGVLMFAANPETQKPFMEINSVISMCDNFLSKYDPQSYTVTLRKAEAYAVKGDYVLSKKLFDEVVELVDLSFPTGLLNPDGSPKISPAAEREKYAIENEIEIFLGKKYF